MIRYLNGLLHTLRPAFSRQAAFAWFVIAFAGFIVRQDTYGVSSIIRALLIDPVCYPCLLHFFHSSAWTGQALLERWWQWLVKENAAWRVGDRIVLAGDHTKNVKDGRKIPAVETLHQDSETGSKPSYFRGHEWGCISLLMKKEKKTFAVPLWAEIHRDSLKEKRSTRIVTTARRITQAMKCSAYLVLDAFFAVGPVFQVAKKKEDLHILTRAKKNVVAYRPARKSKKRKAGRPPVYGKKLKLTKLFDSRRYKFTTSKASVYDSTETVRYLVLDLLWKPLKGKLRFILLESTRGRIILMTSDLNLNPLTALQLYCHRASIETLFNTLKNLLGGLLYHFWSKYLQPSSRRPLKNNTAKPLSSNPDKTENTLSAIEKFVTIQLLIIGSLQLTACRFAPEIIRKARCWLRTPSGNIPSEFITRMALSNVIKLNLCSFAKDAITQLILKKQCKNKISAYLKQAA